MKETRERIIKQALISFVRHDFERVSLNDIAAELGMTKGGIYHYFSSKDDLFREVVLFSLSMIEQMMEGLSAQEGELREFLRGMLSTDEVSSGMSQILGVDIFSDGVNLVYLVVTAAKKFPDVRKALGEIYGGSVFFLGDVLAKAQQNGVIRSDQSPRLLAYEMVALIEGSLLLSALAPEAQPENLGEALFESVWNMLQP